MLSHQKLKTTEKTTETVPEESQILVPLRSYDRHVRILVLGSSGVGKTLWLRRFLHAWHDTSFPSSNKTIVGKKEKKASSSSSITSSKTSSIASSMTSSIASSMTSSIQLTKSKYIDHKNNKDEKDTKEQDTKEKDTKPHAIKTDDVSFQTVTTIGIDFEIVTITLPNEQVVKVELWDTAGQERFHCVNPSFYKRADGILIMFGFDNPSSFEKVDYWVNQVHTMCPNPDVPIVLVGNKTDKREDRILGLLDAEILAEKYKVAFFATSAIKDINLNRPIYYLTQCVVNELERLEKLQKESTKETEHDKFIQSLTDNVDDMKSSKYKVFSCCR